MRSGTPALVIAGAVCLQTVFAGLVLAGLGAPLSWEDEADTAMFGRRILEYGYPKVHDPRNTVYGVHHPLELGVHERLDAYLGSPWAQYYFAAPAVAWSDAADDLSLRTWRVRLPFAIAGWLGVLLLGAVGASLWPAAAGERARFWLGFAVCLVLSVSLQLHLREVRYYPLVVLGIAVVAWLETRRHVRTDLPPLLHTLLLAPVLWCLFNLFYPAFAAVAAAAGCGLARQAIRSRAPLRTRVVDLASGAAPYLLASAAVLPLVAFYKVLAQSRSFFEVFGGPEHTPIRQLGAASGYLLRFEFLLPAAVGALASVVARRGAGSVGRDVRVLLGTCDLLLWFAALWVALIALTPLFFTRYLVPLSPVICGLCVLQAGGLLALRRTAARRPAEAGLVAIAVALAGASVVRAPELRGRWAELREPYRGPLDHVIPYLAESYPNPAELVIATNYEDVSYMFYLGATTTLGFYAPDRVRDLAIVPDVIIPRPWPVNLSALEHLAAQKSYIGREFPVANVRVNNLPELSPRNQSGLVHRFRSPVVGTDGAALVIGERQAPQGSEAQPSEDRKDQR